MAVNRPDGQAVIELAKRRVQITIYAEMEEGWFASKLAVTEIRASEQKSSCYCMVISIRGTSGWETMSGGRRPPRSSPRTMGTS